MKITRNWIAGLTLAAISTATLAIPKPAMADHPTPYKFICAGPLPADAAGRTHFIWSHVGAGMRPPEAGQCAWADRGPSGSEIKEDYGNLFCGDYHTGVGAGEFEYLAVYRQADDNDCIRVINDFGRVHPPFPTNPFV